MNINDIFISSLILSKHPMKNVKPKKRAQYYYILEFFLERFGISRLEEHRLEQYKRMLIRKEGQNEEDTIEVLTDSIISCRLQRWREEYCYFILCDFALITMDTEKVKQAVELIKRFISVPQYEKIDQFARLLVTEKADSTWISATRNLLSQYVQNANFQQRKEKRIIVTANMSAGKSTLINALVGKQVVRTSQEVCTGGVCLIHNKPYEDGRVHLQTSKFTLDAGEEDLNNYEWGGKISIASYFRMLKESAYRICLIDTPGVNSAINRSHGNLSREILMEEQYDILLYILNANKLGTDEEVSHLKWVSNHLPHNKTVFVLNKLDCFKKGEDNIQLSIKEIKNDLKLSGYEQPVICPLSAYFAYLLKKKHYGEMLTEDETDEYNWYSKKFEKPEYDLSAYSEPAWEDEDHYVIMSKKCGMYYLEKILYGGEN